MPLMGLRALILFLLPLLLLLAAGRVEAQQNPILGGGGGGEESTPPAASPGLLHRLEGFIITTQRDVNREINRRLVAIRDGQGAGVILAGLLIAFLYGIFHALGPGHGKTVIVGYFLGRGGSIRRGVAMAGWIALSHVVGAVTVVVIVHAVLREIYITPVEEMLSLRLVSYGAILLIGLAMLTMTIRRRSGEAGACHHHGRAHSHGHSHGPGAHGTGEQRLLAIAAGFLPCSGAILILVFALTNGILLTGLVMTLLIALGMGLTLALLGIASVLAHRQIAGRLAGGARLGSLLALLGPILITGIGAILFAGALLDYGPY
jgi:ABC-type nickel/cobalt efflux system permease component RcnA